MALALSPMRKVKRMKTCKFCGKELDRHNKTGFCKICYNSKEINKSKIPDNKEEEKYLEFIKEWLDTGISKGRPRFRIRKYILKQQDNKCNICGMEKNWNGKELVFILDHINGNSTNNKRENLRMICPNCDSQLPTYKSKNKGKGRDYDRVYRREYKKRKIMEVSTEIGLSAQL